MFFWPRGQFSSVVVVLPKMVGKEREEGRRGSTCGEGRREGRGRSFSVYVLYVYHILLMPTMYFTNWEFHHYLS
jgi:hypothetical protein